MQDSALIKFHSLDLSQYGKNPKGLPVYRIVWADSRVEKVSAENRMHELPLYAGKADGKWVLEKWLSADKFVGMNQDEFQRLSKQMGVEMEYPIDGEYELSAIFPGEVTPALANLWASQINCDQANHTNAERALALREAYDESQKLKDQQKDAVIFNALERKEAHV